MNIMKTKDNMDKNEGTIAVTGNSTITVTNTEITTGTDATSQFGSGNAELISFEFNKKANSISVVFREQSMTTLGNGQPVPDRVWKEIYSVDKGLLFLKAVKNGDHSPGYYVNEQFNFQD